jgi:hypothetical protein
MKSGAAIFRAFVMYRPYVLFMSVGAFLFVVGLVPFGRFLWSFFDSEAGGHVQSLVFEDKLTQLGISREITDQKRRTFDATTEGQIQIA